MSLNGETLEQLSQLIDSAQSIVVALPSGAGIDQTATALAWANVLRAKGKEVRVVAPETPRLGQAKLVGAEEITAELGKQNLVVSFDYSPEQVDKVSYHIGEQTNRFYLTIRPKKGVPPLSQDSLELSYTGAEADLIVFVGVSDLEQLQPLSSEYDEFFRDTQSVVLSSNDASFGTVKVKTNAAAGLSEESAQLFVQLGWDMDEPSASLLLRGIEAVTDHLTSLATTPDTFETVAHLLRAGARRSHRPVTPVTNGGTMAPFAHPEPVLANTPVGPMVQTGGQITVPMRQQAQSVQQPESSVQQAESPVRHTAPRTLADVLNRGRQPQAQSQQEFMPQAQSNSKPRSEANQQTPRYQGRKRRSGNQR